ncbi:hypothetical protein [Helicobacter mesocricetorum]|uniref:hypothetical protein n=1 Tax=Helicobacter mesocricetorum TaxID=87012 RepID=UPI000CF0EF06|nr:hypothetical protein [Helicobacter mesocricetorum]
MKIYQNNTLAATLKKTSNVCLFINENKKLGEFGKEFVLKNAKGKLIDKIIVDYDIQILHKALVDFLYGYRQMFRTWLYFSFCYFLGYV